MAIKKKNYFLRVSIGGERRYDNIEEFEFKFDSLLEIVSIFETLNTIADKIPQPEEYDPVEHARSEVCELNEEELKIFKSWFDNEMKDL